jgi:hypothetical protein
MAGRLFKMRAVGGLVRRGALPTYEELADDGGDYLTISAPRPGSQWDLEEKAFAALASRSGARAQG